MGTDSSAMDAIRNGLIREIGYAPASAASVLISELAETAHQGLYKLGLSTKDREQEHEVINYIADACRKEPGSTYYRIILKNLAAHTSKHRAATIKDTYFHMKMAKTLPPEELTDDHFNVYRELQQAYYDDSFVDGEEGEDVDEYYAVSEYALTNIQDGHLVVSLVNERGLGTLKSILDVLPELKSQSISSLASGAL